jgi:hypothetical protein
MHSPQIATGPDHINGGTSYYGLGWNVNYDRQHKLILSHSGAFFLGTGTAIAMSKFTGLRRFPNVRKVTFNVLPFTARFITEASICFRSYARTSIARHDRSVLCNVQRYGLASNTRLNGVSDARRNRVNPPAVTTSRIRASPACAPRPRPTSCESEAGTQIIAEAE